MAKAGLLESQSTEVNLALAVEDSYQRCPMM